MSADVEQLQKLQTELQMISGKIANERLSQAERDIHQKRVMEIARSISSIAEKGDAPVYIINLNRYRHFLVRSYSTYWIPGRKKDEKYSSTIIVPAVARLQSEAFSHATKPTRYYKAREIADDLCQEINGDLPFFQTVGPFSNLDNLADQGNRVKKTRGTFVSQTAVPAKAQLEQETKRLETYYLALVDEASGIFGRTQDRKLLTTLHFEAAENLLIDDLPWCMNFATQKQCPNCGRRVIKSSAQCQHCEWILDEPAYAEQQRIKAKYAAK